jgi:kynurenine formamidase
MKLTDLSQPIFHHSPNCLVHPPVRMEIIADHSSDGWRMEMLTLATHTGTHVDAPLHKISGGKSLDDLPLDTFAGDACIAHLDGVEANHPISPTELSAKLPEDLAGKIVLLNTGWGKKRSATDLWWSQSPFLSPAGATWLVDRGIKAVGIDHYSIGGLRDPMNTETHTILLGNNVWVLEDLFFPPETNHLPTFVRLMALPIKIRGASGAFCRAVLIQE